MSENLNSYADSVLEKKIEKNAGMEGQISDIEEDISGLDVRVTALEEGGGGSSGIFIISQTFDEVHSVFVLNKSWTEISNAIRGNNICIICMDSYEDIPLDYGSKYLLVSSTQVVESDYYAVDALQAANYPMVRYSCDSAIGYPSWDPNE